MTRVRRLASRAVTLAETKQAPVAVFGLALAVWWIQAFAIPLAAGRDLGTYLGAYVQLFQSNPVDAGFVFGRPPAAPLVVGGLLDVFGGVLAEPVVSVLYAASILCWFLAARAFGGAAALVAVLVVVVYPSYGILFHELSSDSLYAAAFAGWSLLAVRVFLKPSALGFVLVGTGVAAMTLVRPINQLLVLLAALALFVGVSWRRRVAWVAAFLAPFVMIVGAWAAHNAVRFGTFEVASGGSAWPFHRVYLTDKIVRPDNGPASRALARVVRKELLTVEPYRSYGITLDRFFGDPTPRMIIDFGAMSGRVPASERGDNFLQDIALEAIRTHPAAYARGVASSVFYLLRKPVFRPLASADEDQADAGGSTSAGMSETIVVHGRVLPRPSEDEAIPGARYGGPGNPDIRTVWTSPYEHHLEFATPEVERRYDALQRDIGELLANLPDRAGHPTLALRLNQASRWYPPPVLWLIAGIVALLVRRPRGRLALSTPALAALATIVVTATGVPPVPHYSVPVAPAFALLMGGALLGPRRE